MEVSASAAASVSQAGSGESGMAYSEDDLTGEPKDERAIGVGGGSSEDAITVGGWAVGPLAINPLEACNGKHHTQF